MGAYAVCSSACDADLRPRATALATRQANAANCRTARAPRGTVSWKSKNAATIGTTFVTIVAAAVSAFAVLVRGQDTLVPIA